MTTHRWLAIAILALAACAGTRGAATPKTGGAAPRNDKKAELRQPQSAQVCPSKDPLADRAYSEAWEAQMTGDVAQAEDLYRKALELDPNMCDAMDNLGGILRRAGRVDDAIALYRRSLEIAPTNGVALQDLGLALQVQGKFSEAAEQYMKLIDLHPEDPEGFYGLGLMVLWHSDQTEEAITLLAEAERLYLAQGSELVADARFQLGEAHARLAHWKECKQYLEAAYAQFGGEGQMNLRLGLCWLSDDPPDRARAREYLTRARDLGEKVDDDLWKRSEEGQ